MRTSTLVTSTGTGVRPLGVRGEPLHHAESQIRSLIGRRLGDRHYQLLAEPEPHDQSGRIDWYSELRGAVRRFADLPVADRETLRDDIDTLLGEIDALGQELERGPAEDHKLAGRALRLAARRPTDDYLFQVGEHPVVVCWGYDVQAAMLPAIFQPAPVPAVVVPPTPVSLPPPPAGPPPAVTLPAAPPPLTPPAQIAAPIVAAAAGRGRRWLLAALLTLLLLPLAAWLLTREGETVTCSVTPRQHAVVLVLDTSNSMSLPSGMNIEEANELEDGLARNDAKAWARFEELARKPGRKRFDDARAASIDLVKDLPASADAGLITFKHGCEVQVDVKPARGDVRDRIIRELQAASPRAGTPLATAIRLAASELVGVQKPDMDQTVVVLTDGKESCGGDPCAEARQLRERLPKAVIHVVDVVGRSGLQCVADATGGTMVTARTADHLRTAMRKVQTAICR